MGIFIFGEKIHLSQMVSVPYKGLLQTLNPFTTAALTTTMDTPFLLENFLPWLQCTIWILILSPDTSGKYLFPDTSFCFRFISLYSQ